MSVLVWKPVREYTFSLTRYWLRLWYNTMIKMMFYTSALKIKALYFLWRISIGGKHGPSINWFIDLSINQLIYFKGCRHILDIMEVYLVDYWPEFESFVEISSSVCLGLVYFQFLDNLLQNQFLLWTTSIRRIFVNPSGSNLPQLQTLWTHNSICEQDLKK